MGNDARGRPRAEIACEGHFRTESGIKGRATLYDVSLEGCSFLDRDQMTKEGQRLRIWFTNVGPFKGTIRWTREDVAGMEFDKPLYVPIFEHLRDSLKWDEATQGRRR